MSHVCGRSSAGALDNSAQSIKTIYYQTPGGGIRGSIISTFYLIIISLLIALPLGIASAIYLHDMQNQIRLHLQFEAQLKCLQVYLV